MLISVGTVSLGSSLRGVDIQGGHFLYTLSTSKHGPEEQALPFPSGSETRVLDMAQPYQQHTFTQSFLYSPQASLDATFPWLAAAPCRICAPGPRKVWLLRGKIESTELGWQDGGSVVKALSVRPTERWKESRLRCLLTFEYTRTLTHTVIN